MKDSKKRGEIEKKMIMDALTRWAKKDETKWHQTLLKQLFAAKKDEQLDVDGFVAAITGAKKGFLQRTLLEFLDSSVWKFASRSCPASARVIRGEIRWRAWQLAHTAAAPTRTE